MGRVVSYWALPMMSAPCTFNVVIQHARYSKLARFMNLIPNGGRITVRENKMNIQYPHEELTEQLVTYTLLKDGQFFVIENVPAQVNVAIGEQYFAPETVERLQEIILGDQSPIRIVEAPVYVFSR